MASSKTIKNAQSNVSTGQFFLTLSPHHDYIINVSKDGYLFYSDAFLTQKNFDRLKPFIKNVPLLPIEVGSSIVLKNIFFETDKSDLKPKSFIELKKLKEFLSHNPKISIEIAGHTDNIGSYEYNKELSTNRAKAVYDYLVAEGISAARLSFKGYSFDKPIATNDNEEGRAQNRRTEFIIVGK